MNEEEAGYLATVTNIVSPAVVRVNSSTVDLKPLPIKPEWILGGTPEAWYKEVAISRDEMSELVVWECSAGLFSWHYKKDESLIVISGEAFVTAENGQQLRLGPGDVAFFPAGTTCTWRVPGPLRKVAVVREPMWRPLGFAVKAWNRVVQMVGRTGKPTMVPADQAAFSEPPRKVG